MRKKIFLICVIISSMLLCIINIINNCKTLFIVISNPQWSDYLYEYTMDAIMKSSQFIIMIILCIPLLIILLKNDIKDLSISLKTKYKEYKASKPEREQAKKQAQIEKTKAKLEELEKDE